MTKEELFNQNIKLAYYFANKWRNSYPQEIEDIKQIALMGLWKVANKYDGGIRAKFSTFASGVIQNDIKMYLNRKVNRHCRVLSFESSITEDIALFEVLADDKNEIEKLENEMDTKIEKNYVEIEVSKMSERDKEICKRLRQGETQASIALKIGLSQPQVHRIWKRLIENTKELIGGLST